MERRYSGDIAGPKTGNSFASRMAPSISLRRHTTSPHFSPRSRPASRGDARGAYDAPRRSIRKERVEKLSGDYG